MLRNLNISLDQQQRMMESDSFVRASMKRVTQIESTIKSQKEHTLTHGQKAIEIMIPIISEELLSINKCKQRSRNRLWSDYINVAVGEYQKLDRKAKNAAQEPIEGYSASIACILVDSMSSEVKLMSAVNKILRSSRKIFNISYSDMEEHAQNYTGFITKIIAITSEKSEIFTIESVNGRDKYITLTPEWKNIVNETKERASTNADSYSPMIVKPIPHKDLISGTGGYLSADSPLLKFPSKNLGTRTIHDALMSFNSETNPEFFKLLNKTQETPYKINKQLLDIILDYNEKGIFFSGYNTDIENLTELVNKETQSNIDLRNSQRKQYANITGTEYIPLTEGTYSLERKNVYSKYIEEINKYKNIIEQSKYYSGFNEIYFPIFLDFRGRVYLYSQYGLSYKGDELSKALLFQANTERLTLTGLKSMYETLGNCLGHDKKNLRIKRRIASKWFKQHRDTFESGDFSMFFEDSHVGEVFEEPINALSIVIELLNHNSDSEYETGYVNHRDARCSGPSLIGTTLRDKEAMTLTSVIDINSDALPDAYTLAADTCRSICSKRASKGDSKAAVLMGFANKLFIRKVFKKPVMVVLGYGGTRYGLKQDVKDIFNDDSSSISELPKDYINYFTDLVLEALKESMGVCVNLLETNRAVADEVGKSKGEIVVINPITGFPMIQQEFKEETKRIDVNTTQRIQLVFKKYTDKVDYRRLKSAFSPDVVHNLDSTVLLMVQGDIDFDITTIHDSIGSHPNNTHKVIKSYSKSLYKLSQMDYWTKVYESLNTSVSPIYSNTIDKVGLLDILDSKHILV